MRYERQVRIFGEGETYPWNGELLGEQAFNVGWFECKDR